MKTSAYQPKSLSGSYRTADGKAQIEWSLEPKENGPEFSATGDYDGDSGQCSDDETEDVGGVRAHVALYKVGAE